MQKEFVRLCNLLDVTYDGETFETKANWEENVLNTVGDEGYTFATDDEGCEDTAMFACDEMEFVDVDVYDFMGSAYESERFYKRDIVVFMHKETKEYYVLNAENLQEF
jgi:hypothetical protein